MILRTVRDTENLPFPQTHHVGFPKVAARLYADPCAAKRGSSAQQGTNHLRGRSADLYNAQEVHE